MIENLTKGKAHLEEVYKTIVTGQTKHTNAYTKFIKISSIPIENENKGKDATNPLFSIVIAGDSIVRDMPIGKEHRSISIGDAKIPHLSKYLMDNPSYLKTDTIVIMIGTNQVEDISTPNKIIEHQYKNLDKIIQEKALMTPIILLAITPRPKDEEFDSKTTNHLTLHRKEIISTQRIIGNIPGVFYRNINKAFTENNQNRMEMFKEDGIHLTDKGEKNLGNRNKKNSIQRFERFNFVLKTDKKTERIGCMFYLYKVYIKCK